MSFNNKVASTDFDKASLFKPFFQSVYSRPRFPIDVNDFLPCTQQRTLDIINITDMEVYTALSNLDPTKASGIDGIGSKVLRCCAIPLYPIIHHLFSIKLCLWYCDFPRMETPLHSSYSQVWRQKSGMELQAYLSTMLYF